MNIPDEYILLLQVLDESPEMMQWFMTMAALPENARHSELGRMVIKMRQSNETDIMINMINSLNNNDLFTAILNTLKHQ